VRDTEVDQNRGGEDAGLKGAYADHCTLVIRHPELP
jgi:hypothetical protein